MDPWSDCASPQHRLPHFQGALDFSSIGFQLSLVSRARFPLDCYVIYFSGLRCALIRLYVTC